MHLFLILLFISSICIIYCLEPAHGWPIALLYSSNKSNPRKYALTAISIISLANIITNVFIVLIYIIVDYYFQFKTNISEIIAFFILIFMIILSLRTFFSRRKSLESGSMYYKDNEIVSAYFEQHFQHLPYSLKSLFYFGLLLGLINEKEFVILGIAFLDINSYLLIILYSSLIYLSFIFITLFNVRNMRNIKEGKRLRKYLPLFEFLNYLLISIIILIDILGIL
ncbi:MAG: hypothetical protein KGD63_04250 [Candidatus Lokiarchaeota archaeon]|nr:hypothetical protein [Candidatus Lokiarchaeota archaeon]